MLGRAMRLHDADLERAARDMIEEFGMDADEEAERRYRSAKANGLEVTAATWEEIRNALW